MSQGWAELQQPMRTHQLGGATVTLVDLGDQPDTTSNDPRQVRPEEALEMAALLEVNGITDAVAFQKYGVDNVFELARNMLMSPESDLYAGTGLRSQSQVERQSSSGKQYEGVVAILCRGPLMLVVMAVMLVELRFFEAAERVNGIPTWMTLLSLITGMMIASSATQAMSWRVSAAISSGTTNVIRPVMRLALLFTVVTGTIATAIFAGVGIQQRLPSIGILGLILGCVGLAFLLWLSASLMLLNRAFLAGGIVCGAFIICYLSYQMWLAPYNPLIVASLGYLLTAGPLSVALSVTLRKVAKHRPHNGISELPPLGQLFYNAIPYLTYGSLSLLYVFIGQLSGWFAHSSGAWSSSDAIAALNIAHVLGLVPMILCQGISEYALRTFWQSIRDTQELEVITHGDALGIAVWNVLRRRIAILLLCQLVVAAILFITVFYAWKMYYLEAVVGPLVPMLLAWSFLGYMLLGVGLFGCGILLAFVRPWTAVAALLFATVVQGGSNFIFSQLGGVALSAVGTVIGGIIFVALVYLNLAGLLRRPAYVLYQAF